MSLNIKTEWDYTDRAQTYDKRADYSADSIGELIREIGCKKELVADIGAGTGKLTQQLAQNGCKIKAVEPNESMRSYGRRNTVGLEVEWIEGTAEKTTLAANSVSAVFFGSSFNVVNYEQSFKEMRRILKSHGWFACMWNHRDLDDPLQKEIEKIIKRQISDFDYGRRRLDPTPDIDRTGLFQRVLRIENRFEVTMEKEEIIEAWQSHATLHRQSGENFGKIIEEIKSIVPNEIQTIPYVTRVWFARLSE